MENPDALKPTHEVSPSVDKALREKKAPPVKADSSQEQAKEFGDLRKELEESRHQMLRIQADFENAKKRWLKEQAQFQELANGDLLRQLLEIYDDFERALTNCLGQSEEKEFFLGVKMIAQRMEAFLKSYGVLPMEAAGKLFDPARHEAVAHEETDSVAESTVLAELRKGYLMNGRVLRPAAVKVAVRPS